MSPGWDEEDLHNPKNGQRTKSSLAQPQARVRNLYAAFFGLAHMKTPKLIIHPTRL